MYHPGQPIDNMTTSVTIPISHQTAQVLAYVLNNIDPALLAENATHIVRTRQYIGVMYSPSLPDESSFGYVF